MVCAGTSERRYQLLFEGRFADAGVPPPVSGPSVYQRIARTVLSIHRLDPLGDPELLAAAEGLVVAWAPTPGRCALHSERLIVMPWVTDPRERAMCLTHERAHAHLRSFGPPGATESDAMFLTVALAAPSFCTRAQIDAAEHLPAWAARLGQQRLRAVSR